MMDKDNRQFQKDLNAGLLSLVLLSELDRSNEDLYAYDLARRLHSKDRQEAEPALFNDSSLYSMLRNMAARGWLSSRIVPSYGGPPRRYYRITERGRAALQERVESWRRMRDFVGTFVEG